MTEPAGSEASPSTSDVPSSTAAPAPRRGDRALLFLFWTWAGVLVVATIAQLFRIEPILRVLDVKNWFAR